ncbi:MAG: hypothetical protein HYY86_00815 [Candidatus Harrisonbacteria bacterium]|nr:hypothetical protein [Candidatus Harrisonbacteria bacterium]
MKTAIVTTTINVPVLLKDYINNFKKHGHKDTECIVVGDKKTPLEAKIFCKELSRKTDVPIHFFNVADQAVYLKKYPELEKHLVFNSIQRRNIGILFAYEQGAELIITIDDDNFFASGDFVGQNSIVGTEQKMDFIRSSTGWLNVCGFLKEEKNAPFYHRGFPMGKRWLKEKLSVKKKKGKIVVNAGFWLGDPDIDAVTRLTNPINVLSYKRKENFALGKGTWSPFNSQNTALAREIIPAYFLSPMVGRYDDIWAAYVIKAIADYLGHYISFGNPLVYQDRNPHNYFKDFDKERDGMILSDLFCDWLQKIKMKGKNYGDCYGELIFGLEKFLSQDKKLDEHQKNYISSYLEGMKVWQKTIRRV